MPSLTSAQVAKPEPVLAEAAKAQSWDGYLAVIKHGLLENGLFIGAFPIKTSIHRKFPIAIFDHIPEGTAGTFLGSNSGHGSWPRDWSS